VKVNKNSPPGYAAEFIALPDPLAGLWYQGNEGAKVGSKGRIGGSERVVC